MDSTVFCSHWDERGRCLCGSLLSGELDEGRHADWRRTWGPAGDRWESSDAFTFTKPTNAFGDLCFCNTSKNRAKYVRIGYPVDGTSEQKAAVVEAAKELLLDVWRLGRPNLILSVTGGAQSFECSNTQQRRFKRAIVHTAIKTGEQQIMSSIMASTQ